jgi:nitrogen fixation protein NifZ
MVAPRYTVGDLVFSLTDIYNDGGVPDAEGGALLARAGTRGIVVRTGGAPRRHQSRVYLVKFEGPDHTLGPTVGCLEEELTQDPSECRPGANDERKPD